MSIIKLYEKHLCQIRKLKLSWELYPSVLAVSWLILGILLASLVFGNRAFTVASSLGLILYILFLIIISPPAQWRWFLVFCVLGTGLAGLHQRAPWQTYRQYLPRNECSGRIRATVTEATYNGEELPWLQNRRNVVAELRSVRTALTSEWMPARGKIMLSVRNVPIPQYGAELEATGVFLLPSAGICPEGFSYRRYLRVRGIHHLFVAETIDSDNSVKGWRRLLAGVFYLRDRCAEHLAANLSDPEHKAILLAMTLGYREGLSSEIQHLFIRGGAIHLFAISGLHVGIVASLLMGTLILLGLPLKWRWGLLPVLLGIYVLAAGAEASAVRAWLMLFVVAVAKLRCKATIIVNTVAVAALILLLLNPGNLLLTGFQFSFTIVFVLLLGWPAVNHLIAVVEEKDKWIPLRWRQYAFAKNCRKRILQLAGAATLAWLGSLGLVAWYNHMYIPAAIPVNIGLSLDAALILSLSFLLFSLNLMGLSFFAELLSGVVAYLLQFAVVLVEAGSKFSGNIAVARTSAYWLALFYMLLLAFLLPNLRARLRLVIGLSVITVIALPLLISCKSQSQLVIFHGGSNPSPVVVLKKSNDEALLIGAGDWSTGREIAEWLLRNGSKRMKLMLLTSGEWSAAAGAETIIQELDTQTLVLPTRSWNSRALKNVQELLRKKRMRIRKFSSADVVALELGTLQVRHRKEPVLKVCEIESTGVSPFRLKLAVGDTGKANVIYYGDHKQGSVAVTIQPSLMPHLTKLF